MTKVPVLEVKGLVKTFHIGFLRRKVEAVQDVSFTVHEGEIFGILGPNGAGKTTSIKAILGLIRPTRGTIRIFGEPNRRESMKRIGYMPENPYVYQYLTPLEFLDLCGRIVGMGGEQRRTRSLEMLETVGLSHAKDRPIGRFSKGMTQRVGLAQALLHDPEVLILDEPMSGLDPIGRKEVRDVLVAERKRGRTLVFTSHILSDVEMLCDRVVMIHRGKVTADGTMHSLLRPEVRRVEIELANVDEALRAKLEALGGPLDTIEQHHVVRLEGQAGVSAVLRAAMEGGADVVSVTPHRETLEDLFIRNAVTT